MTPGLAALQLVPEVAELVACKLNQRYCPQLALFKLQVEVRYS